VFVGAIDDLFLISTGLSALGALVALLLRSGPAPPAGFGPVPAAPATSGEVTVEGHLVPSATATGNGRPPLQTDGSLDVGINAHPRDT
jgi:hypothetical protein